MIFFQAVKECFTSEIELGIHVLFIERTGHIIFEPTKGSVLFLCGKSALQIGFESDVVLASTADIPSTLIFRHHEKVFCGKRIQSPNPVNVNLGYDIHYIYTDCIEQQLVGDVQAQLLHNVCINNMDARNMQTTSFVSPHYIPVTRRDFDTIEIYIRDETGR